ncbi:hypothetical protein B0H14DRAFT_2563214 [Mycena olivaceomarginata]|nr:hypothetical protein B0H14DRAFT_2563214 [Mycena olivaceomarginata]
MYHDIVSQPTVLRGDRSRAFPIPVEFSDGCEGSECLISIQAVFIWSALWSQSHGPVYRLEPVETLMRIHGIRVNTILPNNQGGPGWPKELSRSRVETDVKDVANKTTLGFIKEIFWELPICNLGASMTLWEPPALPPNIAGCSHAFELMLGAPSIFNWNVGCSQPKLLGDPRYITWVVPSLLENMVGGSQDYYKEAPTTVRRFHENPECRIVVNLAEEGNAFYATAEAGMGVRGGADEGCKEGKSAVSQAEGYNVFHSTEGRHRGREGQNAFYGAESQAGVHGQVWKGCARMYGTGVFQVI